MRNYFLAGFIFFAANSAVAVEWVDKNSIFSELATFMGYEGGYTTNRMYYCRENNRTDGTTVVGKAIVRGNDPINRATCYIPWGGKENKRTENFDVLILRTGWLFAHVDDASPLLHLNSYERGNPIKATYGCIAHGVLGKYFVEHDTCYYPLAGSERKEKNKGLFRVLKNYGY